VNEWTARAQRKSEAEACQESEEGEREVEAQSWSILRRKLKKSLMEEKEEKVHTSYFWSSTGEP
jgi:type VI protein secretion system component Hcp